MHNDVTTPTPLVADTSGSSEALSKLPSYEIAPEDRELAASITNFDVHSVPSPIQAEGNFRVPERFTARALPDEQRREVEQQLTRIPAGEGRDRREHELTYEAMRKISLGVRVRLGAGPSANPFQQETFALQRDIEKLETEAAGILTSLNEVVRFDVTGVHPVTGEQLTKPTYRVEGPNRRGLELRHAELMRNLAALEGPEGDRRLQRALFEAVESEKEQRASLNRMAQAKKMAAEMLEKEEVERMAATFAKNRRHTIA